MNKQIIVGYVSREPVFGVSKDGKEYSTFSVGVVREYNREKTDWFKCIIYGPACANYIKPFLHKGSLVSVCGANEYSSYEKNGITIPSWTLKVEKIEILNSKSASNEEGEQTEPEDPQGEETQKFAPIDDDSLPF